MRPENSTGKTDRQDSLPNLSDFEPPPHWISACDLIKTLGVSPTLYKRKIRQQLQDARVPTIQVSRGARGLRWNYPATVAVLGGGR